MNIIQAGTYKAQPAILTAPDYSQEPAVAIFRSGQVLGILPIADSLRLANQIADSIQEAKARA